MRKKISSFIALILVSALCILSAPQYSFADTNITTQVQQVNNKISISGHVNASDSANITIKVMGPCGNINYLNEAAADQNGNYSFNYSMKDTDVQGTYKVYVLGQSVAEFSYVIPLTIDLMTSNTIYIAAGSAYSLPSTLRAKMSDGTIQMINVTWNPSKLDTSVAGVYTFSGKVSGYTGTISLTVNVVSNNSGYVVPTPVPTATPTPTVDNSNLAPDLSAKINSIIAAATNSASGGVNQNGVADQINSLITQAGTLTVSASQTANGSANVDEASLNKALSFIDAAVKKVSDGLTTANMQSLVSKISKVLTIDLSETNAQRVTIPRLLFDKAKDKTDSIDIFTKDAKISINKDSLPADVDSQASSITVGINKLTSDQLSSVQGVDPIYKTLIQNNNFPVLDMQINADGKSIHNFNAPLEVTIPYALPVNVSDNSVKVFYIDETGKIQAIPEKDVRYDKNKKQVVFTVTHFSKYVVMPDIQKDSFKDIGKNYNWAADAIHMMFSAGIINGKSSYTFAPADKVTRAEFVKMLCLSFGIKPSQSGLSIFKDVRAAKWYAPYIAAAQKAGIIKGVRANIFAPDAQITRQDMCVMAVNALKALKKGVTDGDSSTLSVFKDNDSISDYAASPISAMVTLKIVQGNADGKFAPKDVATRAQAAVITYRILNYINK